MASNGCGWPAMDGMASIGIWMASNGCRWPAMDVDGQHWGVDGPQWDLDGQQWDMVGLPPVTSASRPLHSPSTLLSRVLHLMVNSMRRKGSRDMP